MSSRARAVAGVLLGALLLGPAVLRAEVVWIRNGDRLTGTILSETEKAVRLKTPFGTVLIPKSRIARLLRADGKEEVLHVPDPEPSPSPRAESGARARLVLVITGASFWQAWDRHDAPADPSLRLEVRLDEDPVASWTDGQLDPQDMPGAVVNTFVFTPADTAGRAAPSVLIAPPEAQPGRVALRLDLPAGATDGRQLRLAYQANEGTAEEPAWHDLVSTTVAVSLRHEGPMTVPVRQDRGRMEFSGFPRRHMRNVDTFRLELAPE